MSCCRSGAHADKARHSTPTLAARQGLATTNIQRLLAVHRGDSQCSRPPSGLCRDAQQAPAGSQTEGLATRNHVPGRSPYTERSRRAPPIMSNPRQHRKHSRSWPRDARPDDHELKRGIRVASLGNHLHAIPPATARQGLVTTSRQRLLAVHRSTRAAGSKIFGPSPSP